MTTFQLIVRPDGKAFLTTTVQLTRAMVDELRTQLREWEDGAWPVAIIPDCEVVQIATIELDLEPQQVPA